MDTIAKPVAIRKNLPACAIYWICSGCKTSIQFCVNGYDHDKVTTMAVGVCHCPRIMWVQKAKDWAHIGEATPKSEVPL